MHEHPFRKYHKQITYDTFNLNLLILKILKVSRKKRKAFIKIEMLIIDLLYKKSHFEKYKGL